MRPPSGHHWPTVGMWVQLTPLSQDVPPRWGVILNLDTRGVSLISFTEGDPPLPTFHPWPTVAELAAYTPYEAQTSAYDLWHQMRGAGGTP